MYRESENSDESQEISRLFGFYVKAGQKMKITKYTYSQKVPKEVTISS